MELPSKIACHVPVAGLLIVQVINIKLLPPITTEYCTLLFDAGVVESITVPDGVCARKTTSVACASNWNESVVAASEMTDVAFTCPDESILLICSICCIANRFFDHTGQRVCRPFSTGAGCFDPTWNLVAMSFYCPAMSQSRIDCRSVSHYKSV